MPAYAGDPEHNLALTLTLPCTPSQSRTPVSCIRTSSWQLLLYLKCGAALPRTACVRRRDVHPGAHESDGAQSGGGSGGLPPPEALLRLHCRRAVVAAVRRRCASHFWLHLSGPPVSAAGRPQNLRVGDQLGPTAKPPYEAQIMMRHQIYTVEGMYAAAPCSN